MNKKALSARQERFVNGILKGLTQEQAYIEAGYKARGARANANRLLSNVVISDAIKEGQAADKHEVKDIRARIIAEYCKLAFCDIAVIFDENGNPKDIHDIDPDTRAAINAIDVVVTQLGDSVKTTRKYKLETKKGALDSLAKIKGLFVDRHEINFNSETLKAILGGLPEAVAVEVRAALLALTKK